MDLVVTTVRLTLLFLTITGVGAAILLWLGYTHLHVCSNVATSTDTQAVDATDTAQAIQAHPIWSLFGFSGRHLSSNFLKNSID